MSDAELVIVETFDSQPEAELARGALEAAGVMAMIQADTVGGMRPHVAMTGSGYRLLVRQDDLSVARDVLDTPASRARRRFDVIHGRKDE